MFRGVMQSNVLILHVLENVVWHGNPNRTALAGSARLLTAGGGSGG